MNLKNWEDTANHPQAASAESRADSFCVNSTVETEAASYTNPFACSSLRLELSLRRPDGQFSVALPSTVQIIRFLISTPESFVLSEFVLDLFKWSLWKEQGEYLSWKHR